MKFIRVSPSAWVVIEEERRRADPLRAFFDDLAAAAAARMLAVSREIFPVQNLRGR